VLLTLTALAVLLAACGRIPSEVDSSPGPTAASSADASTGRDTGQEDSSFTFDDIGSYAGGLEVEIAGAVAQQATAGMTGAETTRGQMVVVSVQIRNDSAEDLDTGTVLVTATSGPDDIEAPLVTDPSGALPNAFLGTITPGQEATAGYGFAIPFSALSRVTVTVDLGDGTHEPITFSGSVARER